MRAGSYQQWCIVEWNWVEVNSKSKHPREQFDWWRDMVDASFHAPQSKPCSLDATRDRNGPVLMPI